MIARVLRRQLADRADIAEEFVRVGLTLQRLGHPNLVQVHDVGRLTGGQPYLVMDRIHGRELTDLAADSSVRGSELIIDVARQVAAGLAAAHGAGLLHLDLTPTSVRLVDGANGPAVRIVNFDAAAVARWRSPTDEDEAGSMGEDPTFWAPERASGGELDARSDIYSLGAILVDLLPAQNAPGSCATDDSGAQCEGSGPPAGPMSNSVLFGSVVARCVAEDPGDRFQNADDVEAALSLAAAAQQSDSPGRHAPREDVYRPDSSATLPGPVPTIRPVWTRLMVTGTCAAAIALTIGLWSARRDGGDSAPTSARSPTAISVSFTSDPPGAMVYRAEDGVALGRTPFAITMPPSDQPLVMELRFSNGEIRLLRAVPTGSMYLHARASERSGDPPGDG